jgi:hypothetical protein
MWQAFASVRVCRTPVNDHFGNVAMRAPDAESLPRRIGTPAPHFFELPAFGGQQRAVRIAPRAWRALAANHTLAVLIVS